MTKAVFQNMAITLLCLTLLCEMSILVFLLLAYRKPELLHRRGKISPPAEKAEMPRSAARDAVTEGIACHAKEYDGLYEGLYQARKNRAQLYTDAYEEWCDRTEQSEDEFFRAAFRRLFSKEDIRDETRCRMAFETLLACVAEAGVTRDRDSGLVITADEQLSNAYISMDGAKPHIGSPYTVLKPAWLADGRVVEFGIVMPGIKDVTTKLGEN